MRKIVEPIIGGHQFFRPLESLGPLQTGHGTHLALVCHPEMTMELFDLETLEVVDHSISPVSI
jgi:hypothetical protein